VDIEVTQTQAGQRYSGVWLPGNDAYYLWSGASWQNFRAKWEELGAQNLRLIDLDIVPPGGAQSVPFGAGAVSGQVTDFGGLADEPKERVMAVGYAGRTVTGRRSTRIASDAQEGEAYGGGSTIAGAGAADAGFGGGDISLRYESSSEDGVGGGSYPGMSTTGAASPADGTGFGGGEPKLEPASATAADQGKGGGRLM
jgi:hypothetical protein